MLHTLHDILIDLEDPGDLKDAVNKILLISPSNRRAKRNIRTPKTFELLSIAVNANMYSMISTNDQGQMKVLSIEQDKS